MIRRETGATGADFLKSVLRRKLPICRISAGRQVLKRSTEVCTW